MTESGHAHVAPELEVPDGRDLAPLSPSTIAIHASGALVNGAVVVIASVFLVVNGHVLLHAWPLVIVGILIATFVSDLISGLLHWAFDTWFSEDIGPLQRMVFLVREHHLWPERIFNYSFRHEAGMLSWFGLIGAAPFYAVALLPSGSPGAIRYALAATGLTISLQVVFMLEFHKVGHRRHRNPVVRALQRVHLLLPTEEHLRHHAGDHDDNYCLITGIVDMTLGRLGLFRGLERVVTAVFGAVPREDDHEWARRYEAAAARRK